MKKIGFVDYYISEWHANVYPGWIKEICEAKGLDLTVAYASAERDVSLVDGRTTDEWCKEYGVDKCNSIEELCEKSDFILILAPSNPETHLRLAETVLKYGKNTYIDKTFAPDAATAKRIYELAEKYNTKFFSTSALRYADEIEPFKGKCDSATVFGSGSNLPEYIVHAVEMAVCLTGVGASEVRVDRSPDQFNIRIKHEDGNAVNILYTDNYALPFAFVTHTEKQAAEYHTVGSEYFRRLLGVVLDFFVTGQLPFASEETMETMKIREAIIKASRDDGIWTKI